METILPNSLVVAGVLDYLSVWDLMTCNCVSREWNAMAQNALPRQEYSNVSIEFGVVGERNVYKVGCRRGKNVSAYTSYIYYPVRFARDYPGMSKQQFEEHKKFNRRMKERCLYLVFYALFNCQVQSVYIGKLPIKLEHEEEMIRNIFRKFTDESTEISLNSLVCNYVDSHLLNFLDPKWINFWSGDWSTDWKMEHQLLTNQKRYEYRDAKPRPTPNIQFKIANAQYFSAVGAGNSNMEDYFGEDIRPRVHLQVNLYKKKFNRNEVQYYLREWQAGRLEIDHYFFSYRFTSEDRRESIDEYTSWLEKEVPRATISRDSLAHRPECNPTECRVLSVPNLAGTASLLVRVDYSSDPMLHRVLPRQDVIEMAGDSNDPFHSLLNRPYMFVEIGKQLHGRFIWPDHIC